MSATLLQRFANIRRDEVRPALVAGLLFFCVLTALMVVRPAREALGMQRGIEARNINPEIDPSEAAAVIMSGLRGAAFHWLLDPAFDYDGTVAALDRYLHLILSHPQWRDVSAAAADGNGHRA